jgi:hypothetical protein
MKFKSFSICVCTFKCKTNRDSECDICIHSFSDYSKNIFNIIDHSTENLGEDVWNQVKDLVSKKEEAVKKAEAAAKEAL